MGQVQAETPHSNFNRGSVETLTIWDSTCSSILRIWNARSEYGDVFQCGEPAIEQPLVVCLPEAPQYCWHVVGTQLDNGPETAGDEVIDVCELRVLDCIDADHEWVVFERCQIRTAVDEQEGHFNNRR